MADDLKPWPHGAEPPQLDPDGPDRLFSVVQSNGPSAPSQTELLPMLPQPRVRSARRGGFRLGGVWIAAAAMAAFMLVVGVVAVIFQHRPRAEAGTVNLLAAGQTIGIEATDEPGYRIRHFNSEAWLNEITADGKDIDRADARWIVHEGLADKNCVSFESDNFRGQYLRHFQSRLRKDSPDDSELFKEDATFCPEKAGRNDVFVLRSFNYPGRYLVRKNDEVWLGEKDAGAEKFLFQPPL